MLRSKFPRDKSDNLLLLPFISFHSSILSLPLIIDYPTLKFNYDRIEVKLITPQSNFIDRFVRNYIWFLLLIPVCFHRYDIIFGRTICRIPSRKCSVTINCNRINWRIGTLMFPLAQQPWLRMLFLSLIVFLFSH